MNLMFKRCPSSRLPYLVPLQSHLCPPSPPFLFLLIPHSLSLPLVYSPQALIGFLEESIFQSIFHWKITPNSFSKGDYPILAAYSIAIRKVRKVQTGFMPLRKEGILDEK